jgi:hypothetical protein
MVHPAWFKQEMLKCEVRRRRGEQKCKYAPRWKFIA